MILDPWPGAYMHVYKMQIYMILDPDACVYDAWMKDAYIHDPWPWCMYPWCGIFSWRTDQRTNGRTNKPILGVGWCMWVWCIYLWSMTLVMMDISMILDPWPWCIYVSTMQIYMILDPDSWCMCVWGIRGVQKIQKLSETPATVHRVAKLCINDSKNRKNHEKLVQPVAPHLCMNPKPQKWSISKMSQTYWVGYQITSEEK